MDPWLEAQWPGIRHGMLAAMQVRLNEMLPGDLIARFDEREVPWSRQLFPEAFLRVVTAEWEAPVTAIELPSFSNKYHPRGRRQYVLDRNRCRAAGVSTVEIDLLRDGEHLIDVPLESLPSTTRADYQACIWRSGRPDRLEYYPLALRSRLPRIWLPLREHDPDAVVDLQELLETSYLNGRYDRTDYDRSLHPPLPPDDAAWARERIEAWRAAK
jgi:hypothetical protein